MILQASQTESNHIVEYDRLKKKINIITKSLPRAYYKNILIKLAERNIKNANIISF
jgi:hypothetical protein